MARLVLGSVESGDQTCVTSINLGQKSPEQINKLQICVAGMLHSVMSHDHESQSLINTKQSDNRQPASQNLKANSMIECLSNCLNKLNGHDTAIFNN